MDVRCDRCETEYELEDSSVSDAGTSVQCTTCGHRFIVTRRPSSPLHQVALATPSPTSGSSPGTSVVAPEPGVPEWTLSTDDGKVHRFRDLNTLQKWIVERKASRTDRLSRAGGPWLALGDMDELAPFFTVVDQADRARVSVPTPARLGGPAPASPSRQSSASQPASAPAPAQSASAASPTAQQPPPPVPFDARKAVSPDGPTVPNRRLPDARSGRHPDPGAAITRPAARTPGIGLHPVGHAHVPGGVSSSAAAAQVTPVASSSPSLAATTSVVSAASPSAGSGALRSGTRRALTPEPQRSVPPINRPTTRTDAVFDVGPLDESASLAADFGVPNHRNRNMLIAAAVIVLGGGGAFGFWSQQQQQKKAHAPGAAASRTHVATPPLAAQAPVTSPGSVGEGTTPKAAAEPARAPSAINAEIPPANTAAAAPSGAGKVALGDANHPGSPASASGAGRISPPSGARLGGAARASDSASYDRMVADGDRLLEHGQAVRAEKLYSQALAAKPDGVAALTGIGYVLLDKQRHLKAIETFRRVLDSQPTYGPALFGIAESYRARGDLPQALGAYRQYLAVSPSGSDAPAARRQIKELEGAGERPPSASASRKDSEDTEEE